jgi:hypothetical protein
MEGWSINENSFICIPEFQGVFPLGELLATDRYQPSHYSPGRDISRFCRYVHCPGNFFPFAKVDTVLGTSTEAVWQICASCFREGQLGEMEMDRCGSYLNAVLIADSCRCLDTNHHRIWKPKFHLFTLLQMKIVALAGGVGGMKLVQTSQKRLLFRQEQAHGR